MQEPWRYDRDVDVYGQEAEVRLLAGFVELLDERTVIDVGAERGEFTYAMLKAGSTRAHLFEPERRNVADLRARFHDEPRVCIHEVAVSDRDGELRLHMSVGPDGSRLSFGHTVLDRPETDEIAWGETVAVKGRSLGSVLEAGEIPAHVGILKIDTEGHDLAVLRGLGALESDVVMVEHWLDLPASLGPCPWTTDELVAALQPRGFTHHAFVAHRGEIVTLQWDEVDLPVGAMGNLVFLHDRVLDRLLPSVLRCASSLAKTTVELAESRSGAADERLVVIEELKRDRDVQARAAEERLTLLADASSPEPEPERQPEPEPEAGMQLADAVRAQRKHLEEVAADLRERREPLSPLEARLITEFARARLENVELALRYELKGLSQPLVLQPPAPRVGSRLLLRLRSYTEPRIGSLRHYAPRPLRVPATYARTTPPDPAPTISIVTPSFEHGRFLARTLHSVVSQHYPALEYVVQDGGSSDETLEVLQRFEPMLTSWRSEPDDGQADAINRGFQRCAGEIMAWLNSDDLLLPGALAYVARYFVEHPDVDVVYGHRLMIDEDDGQIGSWVLPPHDDSVLSLADYVPQETLFWRRRIWEAVGGGLDPTFGYALDWDLLLRFRDAGARMVRLPRYLGAFRIHDQQKSTAAEELGSVECSRLRERVHGRPVPVDEVIERLQPFYRRHLRVHYRHRLARVAIRRHLVRTHPPEPPIVLSEGSIPQHGSETPLPASPVQTGVTSLSGAPGSDQS